MVRCSQRFFGAALALILALGTTPTAARAQNGGTTYRVATLVDYDSGTETFCSLATTDTAGPGPIAAAASNTVTGTSTFTNVAAGDELNISEGSARYLVGVAARASASSITAAYRDPSTLASQTLTLTAAQFRYRTLTCGEGANAGAFSVGYGPVSVQIVIYQMNAASIDWRLQCRTAPGSGWTQVYPVLTPPTTAASYINVTAAAVGGYIVSSVDPFAECRVGVKVNTDDGGDTGANAEAISVTVSRRVS